ncbi:2OG-Fe(II) oxygenase [Mesorhizobium sp. B2-3-14]|uniref:2OG-Fe(II) oxygenase n=1 Tax=unclassified Mesorhizobium TaxID=325217 RepID=UPI00112B9FC3|nr:MULTISPECIES: 2OG-Fe(II) oxygenase [unclassified Mesorhizobium]MBZ9909852.1 2OG-Fe(II) oxygenase [Mesorhizobium sp. BR115XR7A]MBZ9934196.1 2OG-Fe(II) oxygenase [Mesorhizobium sp. BR1-1-5]MBZ9975687.1 2OG-Fe(II) oxygenase [Mesorhizobium sp. BR-1-1-10]TPL82741.1 2OG-Fe(II) oxygenase [Mesorhizobium sp. B2-3-14]
MVDYLIVPEALDKAACDALCAEIRGAAGRDAGLLGRSDQKPAWPRVRRSRRAEVSAATEARVSGLLAEQKAALERHFGVVLGAFEKPQFLHYQEGDFFVPHQDGNTPLIHDESRFRKISAVIFLNRQSDDPLPDNYAGGSLVLHGPYSGPDLRIAMQALPGSLIAFRSETTHEVTPVTRGERFSIVSWYRGTSS